MESFFNELSASYPSDSKYLAKEKMSSFLKLVTASREKGFGICRTPPEFYNIPLADHYCIDHWLSDSTVRRVEKDLFLGTVRGPFEIEEEEQQARYVHSDFVLNEPEELKLNGVPADGLAWAYICNTLALGFPANAVWKRHVISLRIVTGRREEEVKVHHASLSEHLEQLEAWIQSVMEVVLIPSGKRPVDKKIHLSDDHGKDKLEAFARRLIKCEYVEEIPQSLPYQPNRRRFIQKMHPDGRVELSLLTTDEGFGLVVRTTGRNLQETREIARILEQKYL